MLAWFSVVDVIKLFLGHCNKLECLCLATHFNQIHYL
jgi:hypothetical protein